MFSECDELAESIWESRSVVGGNGLNVTAPIRSRSDAVAVARHYLPEESEQVIDSVADCLLAKSKASGITMFYADGKD